MRTNSSAIDIEQGYEAVRAQAVGEVTDITPRGLALLLQAGLPAWISACLPLASTPAQSLASGLGSTTLVSLSGELVTVLTEMALGKQRRCYA